MSFPMVRGTSIDTELDTNSWAMSALPHMVDRHCCRLQLSLGIDKQLTKPTAIPNCLASGLASSTNFDTLLVPVSWLASVRAKVDDMRSRIERGELGVDESGAVGWAA